MNKLVSTVTTNNHNHGAKKEELDEDASLLTKKREPRGILCKKKELGKGW